MSERPLHLEAKTDGRSRVVVKVEGPGNAAGLRLDIRLQPDPDSPEPSLHIEAYHWLGSRRRPTRVVNLNPDYSRGVHPEVLIYAEIPEGES